MINPTTGADPATIRAEGYTATSQNSDALGRDAFLKLLVTQLQHQDPTQPKEDGEFLQQLATFSSLEKLTEISTSIQVMGQLLLEHLQDHEPASTTSGDA